MTPCIIWNIAALSDDHFLEHDHILSIYWFILTLFQVGDHGVHMVVVRDVNLMERNTGPGNAYYPLDVDTDL